jgi:HK97 family phage prohead protease
MSEMSIETSNANVTMTETWRAPNVKGAAPHVKDFKFHVKDVVAKGNMGTFIGYASVYGNVDQQGDIVEKGAFTRTLQHKENQVVVLYQHDPNKPLGLGYLEDSEQGLIIKGELNLDVQLAKETYALLKQGALKGLSIGYEVVKFDNTYRNKNKIRLLKELKLWEVSLVTFPANPLSNVTSVKSVVPFHDDMPVAEDGTAWDAAGARKRIKDFATDKEGKFDQKAYAAAFLWYDESASDDENGYPDVVGAYKLPIADVIDGKITVIPKGLYAAAAVIQGSRGGADIPEDDMNKVKKVLDKYYEKMSKTSPWASEQKSAFELGLYSIIGMSEPMHTKTLSDDEMRLIRLAVSALSDLVANSEPEVKIEEDEKPEKPVCACGEDGCTCEGDPEVDEEDLSYSCFLGDEPYEPEDVDLENLLAVLAEMMVSKAKSKDTEFVVKINTPKATKVTEGKHINTPESAAQNSMAESDATQEVESEMSKASVDFVDAVKSYWGDMAAGKDASETTKLKFKNVATMIEKFEKESFDEDVICKDFLEVFEKFMAEVTTKGALSVETLKQIELIEKRLAVIMEEKADAGAAPTGAAAAPVAAPAPAPAPAPKQLDITCPACKEALTVEAPEAGQQLDVICDACESEFLIDETGKVLKVIKNTKEPAPAAAPAAAPAPAPAAAPAPAPAKAAEPVSEAKTEVKAEAKVEEKATEAVPEAKASEPAPEVKAAEPAPEAKAEEPAKVEEKAAPAAEVKVEPAAPVEKAAEPAPEAKAAEVTVTPDAPVADGAGLDTGVNGDSEIELNSLLEESRMMKEVLEMYAKKYTIEKEERN